MHCLPEVGDTYKQCEDKATPFESPILLIGKKKYSKDPEYGNPVNIYEQRVSEICGTCGSGQWSPP